MTDKGSKDYFNNVSSEWDAMRQGFFPEEVRTKTLAEAEIVPDTLAIDLGAGTGFITEVLLKAGVSVIAIDQSEEMLKVLERKFSSPWLQCRAGEGEALPVEEGVADYLFANMYLHHTENPRAAIREAARSLKEWGRLVITDLDEHNFEFLVTEQHDQWMGFDRSDVKNWFLEAGLKKVSVKSIGEECCAESTCAKSSAKVSIFIAVGDK